jgi:tetratricopeptide (TPR) repeat protein
MKSNFFNKIIIVGIISISTVSYAQVENVVEKNELKFQEHFFDALKFYAINNFKKAIENLEVCYQIDPANLAVEFEFSKNYLALKNYFEAELFIDKALTQEPENSYLLLHKVAIYKAQQNFIKAIQIQKELIQINPKYSDDLVLLYMQNQEFEEAEKVLVEIEANGLSTPNSLGYKNYLEQRKIVSKKPEQQSNESEVYDLQTLRIEFNNTKNYKLLQKILIYEASNNYVELLYEDSKIGLELFPTQPFLYFMNAIALNKQGKYNEAIVVLTIGIDFVIEDAALEANFYEQFAKAYKGINNYNEALKYQQKVEEIRQKNK